LLGCAKLFTPQRALALGHLYNKSDGVAVDCARIQIDLIKNIENFYSLASCASFTAARRRGEWATFSLS